MGDHSAPVPAWRERLVRAAVFLYTHKGKILSVVVAATPFLSRYVPGFPNEEVLAVVRVLLAT